MRHNERDGPIYQKLDRLWLEEGLSPTALALRFRMNASAVNEHLKKKFGTSKREKYRD